MEGPEIKFAEAVIDNGKYGKRTVRFETGRLAQQAQGAVAAYLDEETMLLSATSAGKHPREGFDFFPLTVDVEERSYAAGKIPGSFFRREGRPSTEAILVCRLIDRPLRPSFVDGLRNEVQIVITVLSIAPDEFYDALAINAASASTQISGLPFSGPIAGVRLALIGDQWVAFPKASQLADAVFDLTVAGRVVTDEAGNEDVAIMMVEAEATEHAWDLIQGGATKPDEAIVAQGLEAAKPFLKSLVDAQAKLAAQSAKEIQDFPVFPPYAPEVYSAVEALALSELGDVYKIAAKTERQDADDALKSRVKAAIAEQVTAGSLPEVANSQVGAAYKSVTKKVVRGRILTEQIRMDGRGLADIRPLDAEVACTTTTSRPTRPVRPAAWVRRSVARSGTASSPSAPSCRCCRRVTSSRTPSVRSPRRSAPTARPRWVPSAPRPCRCSTPVCPSRPRSPASRWASCPTPSTARPATRP
ncbi:MAG: polyribonucleotide nucleotidyltransferase [Microbacterium sp.]|nr:polyribonucleotide nucleotidyltransferase [Microbacterium sp.]